MQPDPIEDRSRLQCRIALLGFGNVARAFCRHLEQRRSQDRRTLPTIRGIADRSGGMFLETSDPGEILVRKESGDSIARCAPAVIRDPREFIEACARDGVSVLVESLPTDLENGQPALDLLLLALRLGIHVVTVDKGPLVHGYPELRSTSRSAGVRISYNGALGVEAPEGLDGCRVVEIEGIFNGTTNHILTEIHRRGIDFHQAMHSAQQAGIAEPDPSLDIEGWDTACKVLIHAMTWMHRVPSLSQVSRTGIGPGVEELVRSARKTSRRVRLIGRARSLQGRAEVAVAPELVAEDSPFYRMEGTAKRAVFRTLERGELVVTGRSGRDTIAKTILDDIEQVLTAGGP